MTPQTAAVTISEPTPLALNFDEFMALLAGANLQLLGEQAVSRERAHSIRRMSQALGDAAFYLCDEPARRVYEIIYLKLSVFLRILAVMRESQRMLDSPLRVADTTITAMVSRYPGVAPLLWCYRLMITPTPPLTKQQDHTSSFADDAYHFGLLLAVSLLVNPRNDAATLKKNILAVAQTINRLSAGEQPGIADVRIKQVIHEQFLAAPFRMENVFYDSAHEVHSQHVYLWKKLLTILLRLVTKANRFSYYLDATKHNADTIDNIVEDIQKLRSQFKLKLFEPLHSDRSVASLLRELGDDERVKIK